MKSFEETQYQIARLMEVAGGSANAYEVPLGAEDTNPPVKSVEDNPFETPDRGLVLENSSDEPAGDEPAPEDEEPAPTGQAPTPLEERVLSIEGSSLGGSYTEAWEDAPGAPESLDPDRYQYYRPVEGCGELSDIWDALTWTITKGEGATVQLETGSGTFVKNPHGCWVLDDVVKNKRYLLETGSLSGHLATDEDYLLWVMAVDDHDEDFGYIHNGYVFLIKEEKP